MLAVPVVLVAGLWFWSGAVAPGYWSGIGLGMAWFVAASVGFGRLGRRSPSLRTPLRMTFLACALAAGFGFYWTSVRETEVNEPIVEGVPASRLAPGELSVEDALGGSSGPGRRWPPGAGTPRPAR